MDSNTKKKFAALAVTVTLALTVGNARAHHLLPTHTLNCSDNFPCPDAIKPRVHFWIEVFRSWRKKIAILHDSAQPERVYAVFNTGNGCNRSARGIIKRKRNQVKKSLHNIAAKIDAGKKITGEHEQHLAALFNDARPLEIRRAAQRIRCQSGVRDSFVAGLKRYNGYREMIDSVLAEANLPEEIAYLPFVESSYNPAAYSKAGAAGMWQIMPKTARVLGLELNATLDERLDPEAATRAAARYLKDADRRLTPVARRRNPDITRAEINPFIITSYNYGVNGMQRAIARVAPDYMTVLQRYKSPRFQTAVKNFYASFLAARHVAINADEYFGELPAARVDEYQTVVLAHPTSIARVKAVFDLGESQLRPLNRALTRFVWRGWRLIPAGYRLRLPRRDHDWQRERAHLVALGAEQVLSGGDRYTVRRGDTACGIARALRVNCATLIRANNLGKTALIIPGQKLLIPGKVTVADADAATYRVQRGDTACAIAEKFGVGCRTLISHNRLGRRALIRPGQKLVIPGRAAGGLTADRQYFVRAGDHACGIAQKFKVNCAALKELNRLAGAAVIHPGQKLDIPGLVAPPTSRTAEQLAGDLAPVTVTAAADTAAAADSVAAADTGRVAAVSVTTDSDAVATDDAAIATTDAAAGAGQVAVGVAGGAVDDGDADGDTDDTDGIVADTTVADGDAAADTDATNVADGDAVADADDTVADAAADATVTVTTATDAAPTASPTDAGEFTVTNAADALRNLLDTLPDLGVAVSGSAGAPVYSVRVETDETLGHFADWLGIGGAGELRRMNDLAFGRAIAIGQRLLLPVADAAVAARFEQRRTDYHQVLSESLKAHYDLVGVAAHIVARGDSPWSLSEQHGFPLWLLYRLNPALRAAPLAIGQTVVLPQLRAKG